MAAEQSISAQVEHGLSLYFTNRIKESVLYFESRYKNDLRLATCYCLVTFGHASTSRKEQDIEKSLETSWMIEKLASNYTQTPLGMLVQADAYLTGCMIQMMTSHYVKGAWNMRKSYKLYESAQQAISNYQGADKDELQSWCSFGVGMFNLMCSLLPGTILRIVQWVGFSGDRSVGLKLLNDSYHVPSHKSPFACLVLLVHSLVISAFTLDQTAPVLAEANELLQWGHARYPRSIWFLWLQSRLHRAQLQHRQAIEVADDALKECKEDIAYSFQIMLHYQKGWSAYLMLNWREASEYFHPILQLNELEIKLDVAAPTIRAFYAHQAGLCLALAGRHQEAFDIFSTIKKWLPTKKALRPLEIYSNRKSLQLAEKKSDVILDAFEILFVWQSFFLFSPETLATALHTLDACAEYYKQQHHAQSFFASQVPENIKNEVFAVQKAWTMTDGWQENEICRYLLMRSALLFTLKHTAASHATLDFILREHGESLAKASSNSPTYKDGTLALVHFQKCTQYFQQEDFVHAQQEHKKSTALAGFDLYNSVQFQLHSLSHKIQQRLN